MEPDTRTYDGWIGRDAYDVDGDKIGEITDIYYDDETGRPEWVAVKTGLFGTKHSFVPIHGSSVYRADDESGDLQVAFDKDMVKDAPRIDDDEHLDPDQERELWSYYGYDYATTPAGARTSATARPTPAAGRQGLRVAQERGAIGTSAPAGRGRDPLRGGASG